MKKDLLYLLVMVFCASGSILRFSTHHEQMPVGCDEFGYLNLAKAFDNHHPFTEPTNRPWLAGILDTLRNSGITENEISYMITPHAYYLVPGTAKIINQYPPGTSAILSLFPLPFRKPLFPLTGVLLLMLVPFLALKLINPGKLTLVSVLLPLLVFIMMVAPPFTKEFARVNSLLYTFGLLLAAGMTIRRNPFMPVFLIALTVNFRIVNGLMLVPLLFFIPVKTPFSLAAFSVNLKFTLKFLALLLPAIIPLLMYNFRLLGNPLASTYSFIDRAFTTREMTLENIHFYFGAGQNWFIFHLLAIGLLVILTWAGKLERNTFLKLMLFPLLNYLFFIFHAVRIDYYPYASSLILCGFLLGMMAEIPLNLKFQLPGNFLMISVGIFIFSAGVLRYQKRVHVTFQEAQEKYKPLCSYQVVWADLFSGTTEYVCENNGFRYGTTSPRARKMAVRYLHSHGYSQVILVNDNTVDEKTIVHELQDANITFEVATKPFIGKMLIIQ